MIKANNENNNLRATLDIYFSKWRYIVFFLFISFVTAFLYLRYTTYEYSTIATIKIQGEEQAEKLSEISSFQKYGFFSRDFGKLEDELQIIKSRSLIKKLLRI